MDNNNLIKVGKKYSLDISSGVIYEVAATKKMEDVLLIPAYKATVENNQITITALNKVNSKKLGLGTVRKVHELLIKIKRSK